MAWHVILFGAATGGLTGVKADLQYMRELMEASMRARGVNESSVPGAIEEFPEATRAQIVDAFTRLCARVRQGDCVVVYYSGHGLRLRDPDTGEYAYAIAPVGADTAVIGDFGYVLGEEVSAWFWRITALTHNVTWIADCCHAAGVYRDVRRVRGLAERRENFKDLRRKLLAKLPPAALDPDGNPFVVRVCASANDRHAFEDTKGGLLTQALVSVLGELKHGPIVSEDLGRIVVRKLSREHQLPTFAGPVRRWWLTTQIPPSRAFPTAVLHSQGTLIMGGQLLDQRPGDRYVVLDPDGKPTVMLAVTKALAHRSHTERVPATDSTPIRVGATAELHSAGAPRATVALPDGMGPNSPLAQLLTASGYLALSDTSTAPLVARVHACGDSLVVVTPLGRELGPWPADGDLLPLYEVVVGLARQAALLALPATSAEALALKYQIAARPEARVIEIENVSPIPVYASAFEFSPDGRIDLVTRNQPDGESATQGRVLTLRAPKDNSEQPQRLVVMVTSTRIDLRGWTSTRPEPPESTRGDANPWFGVHAFDMLP